MNLNQKDFERLKQFYDESFETYGVDDARSVQWSSLKNQTGRFQALLQVASAAEINNSSVLDVGCGLGDLSHFLHQSGIDVHYTGIDILPEFITAAQEKYTTSHFVYSNIYELTSTFDYIFSSGAMSFKVENNKEHYFNMIKKMYSLANKALAFNMLDNLDHVDDETYAAYSPLEVSDFCRTFCDHVEILTDYLPQDFTIFCYKK